jgi:uncharacterized protein (TIGR03000 family)
VAHGGSFHGGTVHGSSFHGGSVHGGNFHGNGFVHDGHFHSFDGHNHNHGFFGFGYYPGFFNYWPYYGGYSSYYSSPSYYYDPYDYTPTYYDYAPTYSGAPTPVAPSYSSAIATVEVRVPADAQLFIDGTPTKQTGEMRTFVSPLLESGQAYTYDLTARWIQDGKPVEVTRRIDVAAGRKLTVDFTRP